MTRCQIQTVAFGGEGVARIDGLVVFVPFTLPHEEAEVAIYETKKNFARAKLQTLIQKSQNRITAPCPYFTQCGGCQLQHASYPYQLILKKRFLEDAFIRIGQIPLSNPEIIPSSSSFAYRRHITLQIALIEQKWRLCFSGIDHQPLAIDSCLLMQEPDDLILSSLQRACAQLPPSLPLQGRIKLMKSTSGYIGVISLESHLSKKEQKQVLSLLSSYLSQIYLQAGDEIVQDAIEDPFFLCQGLSIHYSPFSFLQNHQEQSERIYSLLPELFQNHHAVLDLYCGIGISSLFLSKAGKRVLGIELNPASIELAKKNAAANALSSVEFICSATENLPEEILKAFHPDALLVNPPKNGLSQAVQKTLSSLPIQMIVYISCHPPTLARDCAALQKQGYQIDFIQGYDMFPQTTHLETVVRLVNPTLTLSYPHLS